MLALLGRAPRLLVTLETWQIWVGGRREGEPWMRGEEGDPGLLRHDTVPLLWGGLGVSVERQEEE